MRNLAEHPISPAEAVKVLEELASDLSEEELIGDLRPYILGLIADQIKKNPALINWKEHD